MKKMIFLVAMAFSLSLVTGCFLDEWFGSDKTTTTAATEYATISGTVSVPTAGAAKVAAKVRYKAAPTTTKVYLLLASTTWTQRLAFTTNYTQVTTVDTNGNFQFDLAVKGTSYLIIVDVNADGKCDEYIPGVTAGSTASAAIVSFVRELNTDATRMLGLTLDKDEYAQGDTITFTVSGYLTTASSVHVEVWNETGSGSYVWTSAETAVAAGEIPSTTKFTQTIPVDGWPSTSTGAVWKAFAAIGTQLLASQAFTISGSNAGDTTAPTAGTLAINAGAPLTGSLNVTLNITLPDANATQMIVSNVSGDYSAATWEAAATSKTWTLTSGAGVKTVYMMFADASGNKTAEISDTIEYTENLVVVNVTSTTADGSYKNGAANIPITVEFSQIVNVAGTPQLTISHDAGADVVCDYAAGTGTATLTFTYIVPAATTDADLEYKATDALALNGGTIKNAAGTVDATLTLPALGAAGSLGFNKALVIDNTAPVLTAANIVVNNSVRPNTITLTYSEKLEPTAANTNTNWVVTNNGAGITYTIASSALQADSLTVLLTLAAVDPADNKTFITNADVDGHIKVTPAAAIVDLAGNPDANAAVTEAGAVHTKDATAPTVTWAADFNLNGDAKKIVFTFSEPVPVANFDLAEVQLADTAGANGVVLTGTKTQTSANVITLTVLTAAKVIDLNTAIADNTDGSGHAHIGNVGTADLELLLTVNAIKDCAGVANAAVTTADNLVATAVTPDTTEVSITGMTADQAAAVATITVTFNDYVVAAAATAANWTYTDQATIADQITLADGAIGGTALTATLVTTGGDDPIVVTDTLAAGANVKDLGSNGTAAAADTGTVPADPTTAWTID